jgi:hypothetical protein
MGYPPCISLHLLMVIDERVGTMSSIGSSSTTEQDTDNNSSFRLSPLRSSHSDVTSTAFPHPYSRGYHVKRQLATFFRDEFL